MTNAIIQKLEAAINRTLKLDPEAFAALAELAGKVLAFEFINTGLVLYIFPAADGVRVDVEHTGAVNVTVRGTPVNMLAYLLSNKGGGEGFTGRMEVIGDIGLAQRFQRIIKDLDLDWEEHLSHWLGDTLAHKLGNVVRGSVQFAKATRQTLEQDVSEYLRYEKEVLPETSEVNDYITAIDVLRDDVERLKLRIDKLARAAGEIK
ncbi:MAG: SCP2 protein [Gammaproteobacteria bacterium]|nr:SCP2 protein [Gammaproteobacteria bacterium]